MTADYILLRQAKRFVFSGLLVTGLHFLVATIFIHLISPVPALANGIAFMVATSFSYFINTLWSFSRPLHGKNMVRFVLVSIIGCFLAMTVSGLADLYGFHYVVGIFWVAVAVHPVTFLLHSFWTYR
jgi:putative flippase GtrA